MSDSRLSRVMIIFGLTALGQGVHPEEPAEFARNDVTHGSHGRIFRPVSGTQPHPGNPPLPGAGHAL
jgi:hypothetical protein